MKGKKWAWLFAVLIAFTALIGYYSYQKIFASNTQFEGKSAIVLIPDTISFDQWISSSDINQLFGNLQALEKTAVLKGLKTLKPGRYQVKKGMSSNAIVNLLRSGEQEPITIRTDDVKTLEALAGRLGTKLRHDSIAFLNAFTDPKTIKDYGFNPITVACMFFPNTYEFFWTISPEEFMKKMNTRYQKFWTPEKEDLAKKIGLNKTEVSILASIVKAETGKTAEASKIAGLYLNRLRINMPLQSDPTATFGKGQKNSQRVYFDDFQNDSPYNTYRNVGLPPGPINFPETNYIDAVLNAEKSNFLYMCAQPGATGLHNFSKTLDQHNVYSRQYHQWLNQRGIR